MSAVFALTGADLPIITVQDSRKATKVTHHRKFCSNNELWLRIATAAFESTKNVSFEKKKMLHES